MSQRSRRRWRRSGRRWPRHERHRMSCTRKAGPKRRIATLACACATPLFKGCQRAAAQACLQRQAIVAELLAREDEPAVVEPDPRSREPIGVRLGADEREEVADRTAGFGSRMAVAPGDRVEIVAVTFEERDFAANDD